MKNRKIALIVASLLFIIVIAGLAYFKSHQGEALPANLREKFRCDRLTKEALSTDKYCNDYNLYKKDHAAGII